MSRQTNSPMVKKLCAQLESRCGRKTARKILIFAQARWLELCSTNDSYPEAFRRHTRRNIFPSAAVFEGLLKEGYGRKEAADLVYEAFGSCMESSARTIRTLLKIPGLYKAMPRIWKKAVPSLFGADAGFSANYYDTGKDRVKFDMLKCPYLETCKKLGCPELAPTFCHSDDVAYGNMHSKLRWNRTKTLARGGDLCDFDLIAEK